MKKILFTIALVVSLVWSSYAQSDGFFQNVFNYNDPYRDITETEMPSFPGGHGITNNVETPLGSGLFFLTALGAAYTLKKKR